VKKIFRIEIGVDFGDQHTDELEADLASDIKDGIESPIRRLRLDHTDPAVHSVPWRDDD
jgi:hypothetical protein